MQFWASFIQNEVESGIEFAYVLFRLINKTFLQLASKT